MQASGSDLQFIEINVPVQKRPSETRRSPSRNNSLERSPRRGDEFVKQNGGKRLKKNTEGIKHKNTHKKHKKKSSGPKVDFSVMTDDERHAYIMERKRQRQIQRRKQQQKARMAVAGATVGAGMGAAALLASIFGGGADGAYVNTGAVHSPEAASSPYYDKFEYGASSADKALSLSDGSVIEFDGDSPVVVMPQKTVEDNNLEDTIEETEEISGSAENQALVDEVNKILEENPEIRNAFNDIEIALRRASIEYGGDVMALIKETCDNFGGDMPVSIPVCVLDHESDGYFTDWKTGKIKVGGSGDTGWYQVTDICEEDCNDRWCPDGRTRDKTKKQDNVELGIIALGAFYDMYDGDVAKTLSAFNAGEGFVGAGKIRKDYVEDCYDNHIKPLDKYDAVWEYITSRDYYTFEDDGISHVYVNPNDGSVRYPN